MLVAGNTLRESVLFIGTQISNLYTAGKVAVSVALLLARGTRQRRLSCLRRTAKVSAQDARRRSGVAAHSEAELTAATIVLLEQHCEGLGEGCRDQGRIRCTQRSRVDETIRRSAIDQCSYPKPSILAAPALSVPSPTSSVPHFHAFCAGCTAMVHSFRA